MACAMAWLGATPGATGSAVATPSAVSGGALCFTGGRPRRTVGGRVHSLPSFAHRKHGNWRSQRTRLSRQEAHGRGSTAAVGSGRPRAGCSAGRGTGFCTSGATGAGCAGTTVGAGRLRSRGRSALSSRRLSSQIFRAESAKSPLSRQSSVSAGSGRYIEGRGPGGDATRWRGSLAGRRPLGLAQFDVAEKVMCGGVPVPRRRVAFQIGYQNPPDSWTLDCSAKFKRETRRRAPAPG